MKTSFFLLFSFLFAGFISAQTTQATVQKNELSPIYQQYIQLKDALVSDDSSLARDKADALGKAISAVDYKIISEGNVEKLRKQTDAIADAKNLGVQRAAFLNLSDNMIALAKQVPSEKTLYVEYCPMAQGSWLSLEQEIKNPYYGSDMISCGSLRESISPKSSK